MERALTGPVALTRQDGTLNPDAVGWAAQPVVDTSGLGVGRGRNKRWEYWNVATPTHIIGLTVSSIDYACVHEVWVYDRQTGQTWGESATVIPARGAVLAPVLEQGRSMARAKNLAIDIDETPEGTARVIERAVPGIAEELRRIGAAAKPAGMLSRGLAGVAGGALIVNLAGSPHAVASGMPVVLAVAGHVIDQLSGGDHV